MVTPVADVARFIIQNSGRTSNLKLQKLLYYAQGWRLAIEGTPLFSERLEAWVHGPVSPEIFQQYKTHRWLTIPKPEGKVTIPESEARHVLKVLQVYNKYRADQLERLSHSESPWLRARNGLPDDQPSNAVITQTSMREFFSGKAKTRAS